jgi:ribosomal protein L40E
MAFGSTNADMLVSYQEIAKETISNRIALFAITARNVPEAETCRSCKVRAEWLERQKDTATAKKHPRA